MLIRDNGPTLKSCATTKRGDKDAHRGRGRPSGSWEASLLTGVITDRGVNNPKKSVLFLSHNPGFCNQVLVFLRRCLRPEGWAEDSREWSTKPPRLSTALQQQDFCSKRAGLGQGRGGSTNSSIHHTRLINEPHSHLVWQEWLKPEPITFNFGLLSTSRLPSGPPFSSLGGGGGVGGGEGVCQRLLSTTDLPPLLINICSS